MATLPLLNLPSMLGTWPIGQPPWPHPMLQLWVSSNEAFQPSQEGRTWGYYKAEYALDSGTCPQTGYHLEHQVLGHHQCLWLSPYTCSQEEKHQGTDRAINKQWLFFILPCVIPTALWPHCFLLQTLPSLFLQRLVNNISTLLWSLVAGNELTVIWDPEMSNLVLCFCPFSPTRFIKQSPYKI